MIRKAIIGFILLQVFSFNYLAFAEPALSQASKKSIAVQKPSDNKVKYNAKAEEVRLNQLFDTIYSAHNECRIYKDEFETTKEYHKRIQACLNKWDEKTFQVNREVYIDYNADSKKLAFNVVADINVASDYSNGEEYIGSNAFGVTRNVTSIEVTYKQILIKKLPAPIYQKKVSVEDAKKIKAKQYIALITLKVVPQKDNSFYQSQLKYDEATLDSPTKRKTETYSIIMKATEYKIFDSENNETIVSGLIK